MFKKGCRFKGVETFTPNYYWFFCPQSRVEIIFKQVVSGERHFLSCLNIYFTFQRPRTFGNCIAAAQIETSKLFGQSTSSPIYDVTKEYTVIKRKFWYVISSCFFSLSNTSTAFNQKREERASICNCLMYTLLFIMHSYKVHTNCLLIFLKHCCEEIEPFIWETMDISWLGRLL